MSDDDKKNGGNLVVLEAPPEKPDPHVVQLLEELLGFAKEGKMDFCCVAFALKGGESPLTRWAGLWSVGNVKDAIVGIDLLHMRIATKHYKLGL
jgi:hypothetical protein